ncbi:hypothetical protein SHIRM173S_04301 [Streptomyces hirsutus]
MRKDEEAEAAVDGDSVDETVGEWRNEWPELDVSSTEVIARSGPGAAAVVTAVHRGERGDPGTAVGADPGEAPGRRMGVGGLRRARFRHSHRPSDPDLRSLSHACTHAHPPASPSRFS